MSGWAWTDKPFEVRGPFTSQEMPADPRTLLIDMPATPPPPRVPPEIRGVARPTIEADEDHQPGQGEWEVLTEWQP